MLKGGARARPYLTPYDHAFASGPVFDRPKSLRAARASFDRAEDGELLWRVFESFDQAAEIGEGVKLGLNARIISANAAKTVRIGKSCAIRGTIRCEAGGEMEIGDTVYVGDGVIISARSRVLIGEATLIAHGVQIFDNDTHPTDAREREAHFRSILGVGEDKDFSIASAPVMIGRGCWLGFNCAVMKGVAIGDGAIVAAHAVVVADVAPRSVVAGSPAAVVKFGDAEAAVTRSA